MIKIIYFDNNYKYELKSLHYKECDKYYESSIEKENSDETFETYKDFINKCNSYLESLYYFNRKEIEL